MSDAPTPDRQRDQQPEKQPEPPQPAADSEAATSGLSEAEVVQFLRMCHKATTEALSASDIELFNRFVESHPTLDRTLGVRYTHVEPQKLVLRLEVTDSHQQPWGVTNGGVYACLGETAASMASYVAAGARSTVMGTSNKTDFLRPTKPGDVIVSTATPEHLGRSSHLWRVEHRSEATGKLCALTYLKTTVLPLS